MPQIALITNQHDDNTGIRMIPQLFQPPRDILIGLVLADIVDKQRAYGPSVVCGCDGSIPLLPRRIPDLGLDGFGVDLDAAGCELNTDGRFAVEVELVASESREQVGLSDARVSDKDDWKTLTLDASDGGSMRGFLLPIG